MYYELILEFSTARDALESKELESGMQDVDCHLRAAPYSIWHLSKRSAVLATQCTRQHLRWVLTYKMKSQAE